MTKSSPEKLAAALRANLKRRKGPTPPKGEKDAAKPVEPASAGDAKPAQNPL